MFPDLARDDVFRLETPRLWLRWPQASDADGLAGLAGDWEVARFTANIPHPYSLADAEQFIVDSRIGNALGRHLRLVMTLKRGDRPSVGAVELQPSPDGVNLGYWLGKPYWGQGLAGEAAGAMIDAFFRVTVAPALGAAALLENAASQALLKRAGFQPVGLQPAPGRHEGERALRFTLDRESWRAAA
jgi:RimJ/RimL family protein N-acetyltransferase